MPEGASPNISVKIANLGAQAEARVCDVGDPAEAEFGNGIASRWPQRDREELALPDSGDRETRVALAVTVDAPFGPVAITDRSTSKLTSSPRSSSRRSSWPGRPERTV